MSRKIETNKLWTIRVDCTDRGGKALVAPVLVQAASESECRHSADVERVRLAGRFPDAYVFITVWRTPNGTTDYARELTRKPIGKLPPFVLPREFTMSALQVEAEALQAPPSIAQVNRQPEQQQQAKASTPVTPEDEEDDPGTYEPGADPDIPADDAPNDPRLGITYLTLTRMGVNAELVKLDKTMRQQLGLPLEGPIKMARTYGYLEDLTELKRLTNKETGEVRDSYGVKGAVEGVNLITGEFFVGSVFYAPSGFQDQFIELVRAMLAKQAPGMRCSFAVEWSAFEADNPRGYSWRFQSLMPMQKNDPLASLRGRALSGLTFKTPLLSPPA